MIGAMPQAPSILQAIAWPFVRGLLWWGGSLQVEGMTHVRNLPSGVVFAVNHRSEWDPIILTALFRPFSSHTPMYFVTRGLGGYGGPWYKKLFYGGWYFRLWGAIPTQKGHHNYRMTLSDHVRILSRGHSMCIFPEGGIHTSGSEVRYHGGVIHLALESETPIVPVHISGQEKVGIRSLVFKKNAGIRVKLSAPIFPDDIRQRWPTHVIDPSKYAACAAAIMQS